MATKGPEPTAPALIELRQLIRAVLPPSGQASAIHQKITDQLRTEAPSLCDRVREELFYTWVQDMIRTELRNRRSAFRDLAWRQRFAERLQATKGGEPFHPFTEIKYTIDGDKTPRPVGRMTARDLRIVANSYRSTMAALQMEALFLDRIASMVAAKGLTAMVADVIDEPTFIRLYQSITNPNQTTREETSTA